MIRTYSKKKMHAKQRWYATAALCLGTVFGLYTPHAAAQSSDNEERGVTLTEHFDASSSTDGKVFSLTTTAGYNFNKYFGVDAGIPVYIVRAPGSVQGSTSSNGMGDAFVDLRLSLDNAWFGYRATLTGTAPSGDTSNGRSTGRVTFDLDNHFDRSFGRFTPFADIDLGNTVNQRSYRRPYLTLGKVASFEAGTSVNLFRSVSVSASLYDVAPWGTQRVFSRIVPRGTTLPGAVKHNRVFEKNAETLGGASLDRDNGVNVGVSYSPTRYIDFGAGYSRSTHDSLNTFSFGIGLNLSSLVNQVKK
jgi:hypothetical protein